MAESERATFDGLAARCRDVDVDEAKDVIPIVGRSDDCLNLAGSLSFAKMDLEGYKAWKSSQKGRKQLLIEG